MKANLPLFLTFDRIEQKAIIEALIFAANPDDILSAANIFDIVLSSDDTTKAKNDRKNAEINNLIQNFSAQKENGNETQNEIGVGENSVSVSFDVEPDKKINTQNENQAKLRTVAEIAKEAEFDVTEIEKMIEEINVDLDSSNRPYRIVNYAGGYQFATLPQYGDMVYQMFKSKIKKNFTNAQLETLSIIAYKQPVTKQEIDRIRGVMSSSEIINILIERELVKIAGRKDVLGKPLLYATTPEFLKTFGLNQLSDLPKLKEIEEIAEQKLREEDDKTELVLNISQEDIEKLAPSEAFTVIKTDDEEI